MTEQIVKTSNKGSKNQESKRSLGHTTNIQPSRKQARKGENPVRLSSTARLSQEVGSSDTWICKNSACRAVLSLDDTFCRRCSCCICHIFDDNKDPSLWLVCASEIDKLESCGLSCHIECAIQRQKVGVVNRGQLMQLDGSYCCASCGKVSSILECWKKQLIIAKDARRVDVLCYRISLSYRLLNGSSTFKELQEIVSDAKEKLETEVGPLSGNYAKMARGIVSRLSVAADVQDLCKLAIEKADAWLNSNSSAKLNRREDLLPAACGFLFEEVTSTSLIIVLNEADFSSDSTKGYMLWYCKSTDESSMKDPICLLPKTERRIQISNLQPCMEYLFRIISYTDSGDVCNSEAKCFTKSLEITCQNSDSDVVTDLKHYNSQNEDSPSSFEKEPKSKSTNCSTSFTVQDSGKVINCISVEEQGCIDGFCSAEESCGGSNSMKHEIQENPTLNSCEFDLNVASIPDLNADLTPPLESSRDEDNGCTLEQVVEAEDDAISHGLEKTDPSRSSGSDYLQTREIRPTRQIHAVESRTELCSKQTQSPKSEAYDCVSTLINESSLQSGGLGHLDRSFEYCVEIIRLLEREGLIEQEFRMKFLTWFSFRSTEQERRVVNTFIKTLIDDLSSLAGQLVDSFSDIITCKRPRNGFCMKLWH